MTTESKRKFIINIAFLALIGAIIYLGFKYLAAWLLPFVIGLVVAVILNRPVTYLSSKTKVPRSVWSILFVLVSLLLIFSLIGIIGYWLYSEAESLLKWTVANKQIFIDAWDSGKNSLSLIVNNLPEAVRAYLEKLPEQLISAVTAPLSANLSSFAAAVVSSVPTIIITVILSIVGSYFITNDYPKIASFIYVQFSDRMKNIIANAKILFKENVLKMLRGYLLIMLITFCELFLGFTIIGVGYASILAVIIAIMDILPVLGTGLALIPWAVLELCLGEPIMALKLIALYGIVTVIRNIIEPKIIGSQVGLSPVITLMSMYLGLKTMGFVGMFGFPITIIILVKLQDAGLINLWKTPKKIK
jgi:sporulation integral membrane protein YtvI